MEEVNLFKQERNDKLKQEAVLVTNLRFVAGDNTYPVNRIIAVKKNKSPASQIYAMAFVLISAIVYYIYISSPDGWKYGAVFVLFFAVINVFIAKPAFTLTICTSTTETKALVSQNEDVINSVIDALTKAIAQHR